MTTLGPWPSFFCLLYLLGPFEIYRENLNLFDLSASVEPSSELPHWVFADLIVAVSSVLVARNLHHPNAPELARTYRDQLVWT